MKKSVANKGNNKGKKQKKSFKKNVKLRKNRKIPMKQRIEMANEKAGNSLRLPVETVGDSLDVKSQFNSIEDYKKWAKFVGVLKARGPDIRQNGESSAVAGALSENSTEINKLVVPIDTEAFVGVAAAIVSHAYNHGWRQQTMQENHQAYPYYAFLFIYDALKSVAAGNQNAVPKIAFPDYLLEILAAIAPKDGIQVGAGTMGYSWTINNASYIPGDTFFYPASGNQYGKMHFLIAENNYESGYNTMTTPGGSYTLDAGSEAFSALITFMEKRLIGASGRYQPYQKRDFKLAGTLLERSNSAFASTNPVIGGGIKGGYAYSLGASETHINNPRMCVFVDASPLDRGFRSYRPSGGDSNVMTGLFLLQQNKLEVNNPNYVHFKPIDFYEFADRLALAVAAMFELYSKDTSFSTVTTNLTIGVLDFLVLCRKILMSNFAATQFLTQSLRFYPTGSDDFIPFLCNAGGSCSANAGTVKLPLFAAENLNALRARVMYPNFNPKTGKMIEKYPMLFCPVLGIYTASTFDPTKYTYGQGVSIFSSITLPTTNFVDCQINQKFVDMDASLWLKQVVASWNNTMTVLSPYIQQLTDVSGDLGINVLTVIGDTFMVDAVKTNNTSRTPKLGEVVKPPSAPIKRRPIDSDSDEEVLIVSKKTGNAIKKKDKEVKGPKVTTVDKLIVNRISQQVPIADCLSIKQVFINPEYRVYQNVVGTVGNISTSTMRSLNTEMWLIADGQRFASSDEGEYAPMDTYRQQWVTCCVKNRNAEDSDTIKKMMRLDELGKAGLLGDLVSTFGGELVGGAIRSIGGIIPI